MPDEHACTFQRFTDLGDARPTLIEGLPGLGMVAAIAVEQISSQLGLQHHGSIRSHDFLPVATFEDARVVDTVRVYAGRDPDVMSLRSAMPIPPQAFGALSTCVLDQLAKEFKRAIFLVGAPARSEEEMGQVQAIATTDELLEEVQHAGIELADGSGVIGGPTGAMLNACFVEGIPAIGLVVNAHPQLPDPGSARALIENALEPLVDFDIDTTQLQEEADEIQRRLRQVEENYRRMQQQAQSQPGDGEPQPGMYG